MVVIVSYLPSLQLYDPHGQLVSVIPGHTNAVCAVQLANSHSYLTSAMERAVARTAAFNSVPFLANCVLSGSWDGTFRLTDTRVPAFEGSQSVSAHKGAVYAVQQRGYRLLTGGSDGIVCVYDVRTLRRQHAMRCHAHAVDCVQFDDRRIVTGSRDAMLRVWRFDGGDSAITV